MISISIAEITGVRDFRNVSSLLIGLIVCYNDGYEDSLIRVGCDYQCWLTANLSHMTRYLK